MKVVALESHFLGDSRYTRGPGTCQVFDWQNAQSLKMTKFSGPCNIALFVRAFSRLSVRNVRQEGLYTLQVES